jgi:hypothetical protein
MKHIIAQANHLSVVVIIVLWAMMFWCPLNSVALDQFGVLMEESDGSPSGYVYKIKVPNDSLSISGNVGTYSDDIAALTGTAGDILYWGSGGAWTDLAIGSSGEILKVSASGYPEWSNELTLGELIAPDGTPDTPGEIEYDVSAARFTLVGDNSDTLTIVVGDTDTQAVIGGTGTASLSFSALNLTTTGTLTSSILASTPQTISVTTEANLSITSTLVLIGGDNDADNDTVDLQNGTVTGQILVLVGIATIDADDTIIMNYADTTCTGCAAVTFDDAGDVAVYVWTGSTWALVQHKAVD